MHAFDWLMEFYASQCDGDWEDMYGFSIGTADNPALTIEIDLVETKYDELTMQPVSVIRSDSDWIYCQIIDRRFQASCGLRNFSEAIDVLRKLIESQAGG